MHVISMRHQCQSKFQWDEFNYWWSNPQRGLHCEKSPLACPGDVR